MTHSTAAVGLLDFEVELRLKETNSVIDPFIGLMWHIRRSGHPAYVEAVRRLILHSPRLREFIKAQDRKGSRRAFEQLAASGRNGEGQPVEDGSLTFTDEELDALSADAAEKEQLLEQLIAGNTGGGDLVAEHLIFDITKADGTPVRRKVYHCGEHAWNTGEPRCPHCRKQPAQEALEETQYTPAMAMHIWEMTDKVSRSRVAAALGEDHPILKQPARGDTERTKPLGEVLLAWIIGECERIESGLKTIGEDLAGN